MAQLATIAAFGFPDFNPPTLLSLYRRLGCRSCQFYRNIHNPPQPTDARKIVEDLGMPFDSVHGVFGPEYDPSSPDESIRKRSVETYRQEGELALKLGAKAVVVHPSSAAQPNEPVNDATRQARRGPLFQSMEDLNEIGRKQGVCYLFENLPGNYRAGSDPIQLARLILELKSPHLRMCLDFGHAQMTGHIAHAIEECRDAISYLHVHDNDAKADSHMIPGDGTLPWETVAKQMRTLPAATPAMLELFFSEAEIENRIRLGLKDRLSHWLALSPAA
jgi:sugar phosphate isomerase/epimerase